MQAVSAQRLIALLFLGAVTLLSFTKSEAGIWTKAYARPEGKDPTDEVVASESSTFSFESNPEPSTLHPRAPRVCTQKHRPAWNGTLLPTDYIKVYQDIYRRMMIEESIPKKFVLLRHCDGTGFGNVMRNFHSLFILAIATDRVLVSQYSLLMAAFDPPDGVEWRYEKFAHLPELHNPVDIDQRFQPVHPPSFSGIINQQINHQLDPDWESYQTKDTISHCNGQSFDAYMLTHPKLNAAIQKIFNLETAFNTQDFVFVRSLLMQQTMTYLLGNPSPRMVIQANHVMNEMGFPGGYDSCYLGQGYQREPNVITMSVRYRTIMKSKDQFMSCFPHALKIGVEDIKKKRGIQGDVKVIVFMTTDLGYLYDVFKARYESRVHKLVWNPRQEHTETNRGRYHNKDWQAHPEEPLHPGLVDWFILGEADIVYGSMTTFVQFGAARTGRHSIDELSCSWVIKKMQFKK